MLGFTVMKVESLEVDFVNVNVSSDAQRLHCMDWETMRKFSYIVSIDMHLKFCT